MASSKFCKFGFGCTRTGCRWTHGRGWDPEVASKFASDDNPLCKFGYRCRKKDDCKFHHIEMEEGDRPSRLCRFGLACRKKECRYNHPDKWDPELAEEMFEAETPLCRYGEGCKNKDRDDRYKCTRMHP